MGGLDPNQLILRLALATAALAVLLFAGSRPRFRRAALGALALVSFAAGYNFFVSNQLQKHEFFHYYLGSKYSPELGYLGIYRCSLAAAFEQGFEERDPLFWVTDLRDNDARMFWAIAPSAPRCDGAFSPERWEAFKTDVARFREILGSEWRRVLADHGYNPSPVWTLIGRPLASVVPVQTPWLWLLARLDLALLLSMLAAVGWAFGFEIMCLAAIAWGVNANYRWVGDAFLRQVWLWAAVLGMCLLRKGRPAGAGALLTLSALLRIFPALFGFGYVLRELRLWLRSRTLSPGFRRFMVSAFLTGLVLVTAAAAVSGRGPGVYREFWSRISVLTAFVPNNGFGLRHLLSFKPGAKPQPEAVDGVLTVRTASVQKLRSQTLADRRLLYWGAMAVYLALFWRAMKNARDWEAAALGAALIPVLTMPAAYYLSFVLATALLAERRPRIGVELMLTLLGWNLAYLWYPNLWRGYAICSAVGLVFFLAVLLEMQRAPAADPQGQAQSVP
jgi:hypothetical protein